MIIVKDFHHRRTTGNVNRSIHKVNEVTIRGEFFLWDVFLNDIFSENGDFQNNNVKYCYLEVGDSGDDCCLQSSMVRGGSYCSQKFILKCGDVGS